MARLQFSRQTASDLEEIDLYTVTTWGPEQADRYLDSLESLMLVLAESPMMGRPCGSVRRGYRRMEHDHHVIFYSIGQKSVLTNAFFMNGGCRACKCPVIGNLIR